MTGIRKIFTNRRGARRCSAGARRRGGGDRRRASADAERCVGGRSSSWASADRRRRPFRHAPRLASPHKARSTVTTGSRTLSTAPADPDLPGDHHLLHLGDRLGRVEALRAGLRAVHDGVAAIEAEGILEIVEALAGRLVARIDQPAIGLEQRGRAEIALAIPPIARAGGRAAGAEDALVEPVELLAVLVALPPFLLRRGRRRS